MMGKYRVYLHNVKVNLQHCGFGEGPTHDIAIQNALDIARLTDSDAYYCEQTGMVNFEGKVYL